jgi:hypothetical protein
MAEALRQTMNVSVRRKQGRVCHTFALQRSANPHDDMVPSNSHHRTHPSYNKPGLTSVQPRKARAGQLDLTNSRITPRAHESATKSN